MMPAPVLHQFLARPVACAPACTWHQAWTLLESNLLDAAEEKHVVDATAVQMCMLALHEGQPSNTVVMC